MRAPFPLNWDVRFAPESGHQEVQSRRPLGPESRHWGRYKYSGNMVRIEISFSGNENKARKYDHRK